MPQPLNVLVADDEPKIRQILEQILTARECHVRLAQDGLDALAKFQEQPADLVITDIRMPKLNGIELLRELKHLDPLLNVVVITAYPSMEGAVEAMKIGACDFISKPFDIAKIQAILYRCQQRVTLTRQLRHAGEGLLKLEELNRRLSEVNDMKSQFLAALSHEINTPLCLMSEWLYLLSDEALGQLSQEQSHALDVLINAYQRLHRILRQLIDLMLGHEIVLQRQVVNAQDLVQDAVTAVLPKAAQHEITVTAELPESTLPLEADRGRCTAALEFLLENGVKFNHDHGQVIVTLEGTAEKIRVTVRDTGIGIPPEELDKVFAPFYQVDRRLNRAHEGAGIGLTLAKRYIELHNGSLQLTSEVGKGTTAVVELPRKPLTVSIPHLSSAAP